MKRLIAGGLLALAGVATLALPASAQTNPNLEIGVKPYGSYDSTDFDSISVTNNNLFLHIPFLSYPERGSLPMKLYITYNGKNFSVFQWCNTLLGTCQSRWIWGSLGGHGPLPGVTILSTDWTGGIDTYVNPPGQHYWSTITWDGSIHQMGIRSDGTQEALDGGGLRFNRSTTDLRARNGNVPGIQDTNGNYFSENASSNYNLLDTLARTFPTTDAAPISTSDYTGCTGPLATSSAYLANYPGLNSGILQVKKCFATGMINTNFNASNIDPYGNVNPIQELHHTEQFLQTIIVYDGNSWATSPKWAFTFDAGPSGDTSEHYGDLLTVTLPTGGTISYAWYTDVPCGQGLVTASRSVGSRTINANDSLGNLTTLFLGTTTTDPMGNDTVHVITALGGGSCSYYETQTDYYQGSHTTGTLLKTIKTTYQYRNNPWDSIGDGTTTMTNVFPTQITTVWPNGKTSQVQKTYDANLSFGAPAGGSNTFSYGNPTEVREYDYGSGVAGPLLRRTDYTYLAFNNPSYLTAHMIDRVASETVYNGNSTRVANTTYGYDEYALQTTSTPQHTTPTYIVRGNLTSVHRWLNTTGGTLNTTTTYFDTGMPYQVTDPAGHTSTFSYSSIFDGAYVTQTNMPDTNSPNLAHHVVSGNYDFNTGLLTSLTDQNSQTSNYSYDSLHRMTSASFPDGGQTTFHYPDLVTVERQRKIDASLSTDLFIHFDGLGREIRSQLNSDPQGIAFTDTTYDALGRVSTLSNPYRTTTDPTYGIASSQYDALGRVTKVIPPDGTSTANNVTTTYSGNCTTVTDQAGKSRKSCTDAFGRLIQVFEPDASNALTLETDYQYDVLNNLTRVDQKGNDPNSANWRARTFTYNSLSQLLSATNPESGTITYDYDNDGNMVTKTSPAPNQTGSATVTTTYAYDTLHRLTGKTYSNGDTAVSYAYDQANCLGQLSCFNIGRRTGMTDAAGSESWAYDKMGRPLTEQRTTNSVTKNTLYTYNLDGSLATLTYPSGRTITYTPNAAGRTVSAVDSIGPINYATAAFYAPQGALSSLTNGASLVGTFFYNNRLQPCRISVKSSGTAPGACADALNTGNLLDYTYNFSLGSADNGNVTAITNNRDNTRSQNFAYDALNRLASAQTQTTGVTIPNPNCWGLTFGYDPWGNLLSSSTTGPAGCGEPLPLNVSATPSNQISGYCYDSAGNLLALSAPPCPAPTYNYNAENQLAATAGVTYTYDGDGKRVQKSNGKLYWYGMGSDPLDETDLAGNINNASFNEYIFFNGKRIARRDSTNAVNYYFADHLGTSRVVTNAGGTILDDSDFYPFGGERPLISSSGNSYKFTGKERDTESGLDYFGARYYASTMGRFSSVDPKGFGLRHLLNPQKLNKYSYVLNNPLSLFDPNGMEEITITYRTFIPAQSFTYLGKNFSGDGRGFSTAANASSRSSITVKLETDASKRPGNPIISVTSSAGPSQRLDANGNVTKEATATVGLPAATGTRDANGNPVINITQDTKNPLSPVPQFMTPGISANLSVTVPQDASSAQVTGKASVFPAEELNVTRADGNTTPVLQFEPAPGATPTDLFRRDRPVDAQKSTPQCSTDDKGKKVCSQ